MPPRDFSTVQVYEDLQDHEGSDETSEIPIWRSCDSSNVAIRCIWKKYLKCPEIQISTTFGEGVNMAIKIFGLDLRLKTSDIFFRGQMTP